MLTNFVVFNELSCGHGIHTSNQIESWLRGLARTLQQTGKMGIRRMRVRHDFWELNTLESDSMAKLIAGLPQTERVLLLTVTDSPYIKDTELDEIDQFFGASVVKIDGRTVAASEGLLCAFVHKTLAVSFSSGVDWEKSTLSTTVVLYPRNNAQSFDIAHASNPEHVIMNQVFIGRLGLDLSIKSPNKNNPLPNAQFATKFLAHENWQSFSLKIHAGGAAEKIPIIESTARDVALVNGYDEERTLSALNAKTFDSYRQIFSISTKGEKLFLSTDFEKGAFEVCDSEGRHVGEWLFSGVRHKGRDESGDHDLVFE